MKSQFEQFRKDILNYVNSKPEVVIRGIYDGQFTKELLINVKGEYVVRMGLKKRKVLVTKSLDKAIMKMYPYILK